MPLPPRYACHYCGEEVNPKSHLTLRLLSGWVAGPSSKTLQRMEQEHHKYSHEWCLPQAATDQTPPLF